jgi:hypothetical protein
MLQSFTSMLEAANPAMDMKFTGPVGLRSTQPESETALTFTVSESHAVEVWTVLPRNKNASHADIAAGLRGEAEDDNTRPSNPDIVVES